MKKLKIEWKHFDRKGKTCTRCSKTGNNLYKVIKELDDEFISKGIHIEFKETKLPETRMPESNMILLNGVPLEELIPNTKAGENNCCSCSQLLGKLTDCRCRTIRHKEDTFEEVPAHLIKQAIIKKLHLEGLDYQKKEG